MRTVTVEVPEGHMVKIVKEESMQPTQKVTGGGKFEFEGETYFTGYTKEYVKVAFETEENMTNQFVTGKIKGKLKDDIYLLVEF